MQTRRRWSPCAAGRSGCAGTIIYVKAAMNSGDLSITIVLVAFMVFVAFCLWLMAKDGRRR